MALINLYKSRLKWPPSWGAHLLFLRGVGGGRGLDQLHGILRYPLLYYFQPKIRYFELNLGLVLGWGVV